MIKSFTHKGLERYYLYGDNSGIQAKHQNRIHLILTALDMAEQPNQMDIPGFKLHPLAGTRRGTWAVSVSGNWRLTFVFGKNGIEKVNLEDYH